MGTLSFNGNKTVTTGGGGAIITNDPDLARRAKHLTTTAKVPHRWEYLHDEVGFNYRLPNINAALGCAQLEQLPNFLGRSADCTSATGAPWRTLPEVRLVAEPPGCRSNYWLQTLLLNHAAARPARFDSGGDQRGGFDDPTDVDPDASLAPFRALPEDASARRRVSGAVG